MQEAEVAGYHAEISENPDGGFQIKNTPNGRLLKMPETGSTGRQHIIEIGTGLLIAGMLLIINNKKSGVSKMG